jgi:hypothetical protein
MTTLRAAFEKFHPAAFPSIRAFCGGVSTGSVRQAITEFKNIAELEVARRRRELWNSKLRELEDLFGGGTDEEDEDKALGILLSADSSEELIFYIKAITWSELDDDLDEPDLDAISDRLSTLIDHEVYIVYRILREYVGHPETLHKTRPDDIAKIIAALPALRRQELIDKVLVNRDAIINGMAFMTLRGVGRQSTYFEAFRSVLDFLQRTGQYRSNELLQLFWEVFYVEQLCDQLKVGAYPALLRSLIDLVNPALPDVQRFAFREALRRLQDEFEAMESLIDAIGNESEKRSMEIYRERRKLFLDNFPLQLQQPNAIQQAIQAILTQINGVIGGFNDLSNTIQTIAQSIANFGFSQLLGTNKDDIAVNLTNRLKESMLILLPSSYKLEIINSMFGSGVLDAAEDEEEQAVLKILRSSKERSVAEFLQLVVGVTWERLDNNFDGQEHSDLVTLFVF